MAKKSTSSSQAQHFSTTLELNLAEKLKQGLEEQGFDLSQPQYTIFSGKKKGITCTLYQSGKLLVQGKAMQEFIEFYLEPEILGNFSFSCKELLLDKTERIGVDEAGKGDFFGPLCIAGVHGKSESIEELHSLGVCDSKRINDRKILDLSKKIKKICTHHIVTINPKKYNELYKKFLNLNHLLAWGHATAIENLINTTKCQNVLIDQFANERVVETALEKKNLSPQLKQRHRAEEDIIVAAASILARSAFLEGLAKLNHQYSFNLLKGASAKVVALGKKLVAEHGVEILSNIGKIHFKTYDDILL